MKSRLCARTILRDLVFAVTAAAGVFSFNAAVGIPAAAAPPAGLAKLIDASSPVSEDSRHPVPAAEAQRKAVAKIRDIFAPEYARAKTADERRKLARTLLDEAIRSNDPVDRWSLFGEGMRTAAAAGDVGLTLEATDEVVAGYQVDLGIARLDALLALADKAPPQAAEIA